MIKSHHHNVFGNYVNLVEMFHEAEQFISSSIPSAYLGSACWRSFRIGRVLSEPFIDTYCACGFMQRGFLTTYDLKYVIFDSILITYFYYVRSDV